MAFEKQNNKLKESLKEKKEDLTQEVSPSNSFENLLDPSISSKIMAAKIMAAFEDNQEEEDALAEIQEYLNGLDPLENSDSQPNDQKNQFYDMAYSYYSQNNQMVVNDPKRELYAMSNQEINLLTSSPKLEFNENNQEIK